jgi:hypothetical protein
MEALAAHWREHGYAVVRVLPEVEAAALAAVADAIVQRSAAGQPWAAHE